MKRIPILGCDLSTTVGKLGFGGGMKRVHDSLFVKGMWKPSFADTYSVIYSLSCIKFDAD